jgi:hypothetical protein
VRFLSGKGTVITFSFFLSVVFLALEDSHFPLLTNWSVSSVEAERFSAQSKQKIYEYAAANIFDQGYFSETGQTLADRFQINPGEVRLSGSLVLVSGKAPFMVELILPDDFKDGVLSFKLKSGQDFRLEISTDLSNWKSLNYPGFKQGALYDIPLNEKDINLNGKTVILKFSTLKAGGMEIFFDRFQYRSHSWTEEDKYGLIFYPDIEVDDQGKTIDQPGIIYEKRKNQEIP